MYSTKDALNIVELQRLVTLNNTRAVHFKERLREEISNF